MKLVMTGIWSTEMDALLSAQWKLDLHVEKESVLNQFVSHFVEMGSINNLKIAMIIT